MLLDFVAEHYPSFLPTYCSYQNGVNRADAARYLLLHHFGGVYADLDCECVAPFDPIMDEHRIVVCQEPDSHWALQCGFRGLPYLLFNGTIASPPGHPFWPHLLSYLSDLADAKEVIDATGPCLFTSAKLSFPDQTAFAIHPSTLFTPVDRDAVTGVCAPLITERTPRVPGKVEDKSCLSVHYWARTWWSPMPPPTVWNRIRCLVFKACHQLTKGKTLHPKAARRSVDPACLSVGPPSGGNVAILVPLRDAADQIEFFLATIQDLDYPKDRIKLVFCEGDSVDESWRRLQSAVESLGSRYRDIVLLQHHVGTRFDHKKRWKPRFQRSRRSGIAKVRNHLIENGLDATDDWALWIDIDVWRFPRDIIGRLMATGRRIVVPNCVVRSGGPSFDLNSFVTNRPEKDHHYYRSISKGLYQPLPTFVGRLHLSDLRHLEIVELHGVGGTMLLVDAALHRGGLCFPEIPYRDLIETEAFAAVARELGVVPVGLPQVEVLHVPW